MPIDPKKIEEWQRLAEFERTDGCDKRELRELAGEAVPALLAEREEMLTELENLAYSFVPSNGASGPGTSPDARLLGEVAQRLLRDVVRAYRGAAG